MVCKTWSQPDGNHIRGLCTNELFAEGNSNNCSICVTPIDGSVSGCGCPPPKKLRAIHYMRISFADGVDPGGPGPYFPCWLNGMLGDHVMTGTCGGGSVNLRETHNPATNRPPSFTLPDCYIAEFDTVPRFFWTPLAGYATIQSDGTYRMPIEVRLNIRTIIWQGAFYPFPDFQASTPYKFRGMIPWCTHSRGSGTLGQTDLGIFPATYKAIFSTEPFT